MCVLCTNGILRLSILALCIGAGVNKERLNGMECLPYLACALIGTCKNRLEWSKMYTI